VHLQLISINSFHRLFIGSIYILDLFISFSIILKVSSFSQATFNGDLIELPKDLIQIFGLYDAFFFQAIDSYFTEPVIDVLLKYATQKDTIETSFQITQRL
jgi:hypothetical protein